METKHIHTIQAELSLFSPTDTSFDEKQLTIFFNKEGLFNLSVCVHTNGQLSGNIEHLTPQQIDALIYIRHTIAEKGGN